MDRCTTQDEFPFDNQKLALQVSAGFTCGSKIDPTANSHPAELRHGKEISNKRASKEKQGGDRFTGTAGLNTKEWDFENDDRVEAMIVERNAKSKRGNLWKDMHFSVCAKRVYKPYLFNGEHAAAPCRLWLACL